MTIGGFQGIITPTNKTIINSQYDPTLPALWSLHKLWRKPWISSTFSPWDLGSSGLKEICCEPIHISPRKDHPEVVSGSKQQSRQVSWDQQAKKLLRWRPGFLSKSVAIVYLHGQHARCSGEPWVHPDGSERLDRPFLWRVWNNKVQARTVLDWSLWWIRSEPPKRLMKVA